MTCRAAVDQGLEKVALPERLAAESVVVEQTASGGFRVSLRSLSGDAGASVVGVFATPDAAKVPRHIIATAIRAALDEAAQAAVQYGADHLGLNASVVSVSARIATRIGALKG